MQIFGSLFNNGLYKQDATLRLPMRNVALSEA